MVRSVLCILVLLCLANLSTATLSRLQVQVAGVARNTAYGKTATSSTPGDVNFQPAAPAQRVTEVGASGYVVSDHEDILCGYDLHDDCAADYPPEAEVVLVATPFPGSRFAGWEYDAEAAITGVTYLTSDKISNSGYFENPPAGNTRRLRPPPKDHAPEGPVSARFRVTGTMVRVRALFVLNELPQLRLTDNTPEFLTLPIGVRTITYNANILGGSGKVVNTWNSATPFSRTVEQQYAYGIPEFTPTGNKNGGFTVSFQGSQLDDEVDALVRDVQWICSDDADRARQTLALESLTGKGVQAKKQWAVVSPVNLPEYSVCQVNITAFTNVTSNNVIPLTFVFSHLVLIPGGARAIAGTSHILTSDYQVASNWQYFSDFITSIPAGLNIPAGKTVARRYKMVEAPPAGRYAMDVNIQIKGTTIGTDLVTCTAGFVTVGSTTVQQPAIIDFFSRASAPWSDAVDRLLRDSWEVWFPEGSNKVQHIRRLAEMSNNQTPPEVYVACKNLKPATKKRDLAEVEQVGRSVAVGPISVSFFSLDTPWILDSVVMNYRFGNMVTKTPN
jgi:hypothetical protein